MMSRLVLTEESISPQALQKMGEFHQELVQNVARVVKADELVIVGMAQNPFVKKARQALEEAGIGFTYLEFGNYFSQWKQRLAIKLCSGLATFPQVFVKGSLIGGYTDLKALIDNGELKKRLAKA